MVSRLQGKFIQGKYIVSNQTKLAENQSGRNTLRQPNSELLAAINEHRTTETAHFAYVVPMSELWEGNAGSDEKCIVVPLPGIRAEEIEVADERLFAEVRGLPDGTALECVMMARERIALSGAAVHSTGAEHHGRLLVLWYFDDQLTFSQYRIDDDLTEDMWVASRIAESHSTLKTGRAFLELADQRRVIDVSAHIVVGIPETC
jgi:hypothetical protein